jgi:molecular chaperone IbpA
MRNMLDFSPYRRSLIGFDHLFNLLENATTFDVGGYPPYDVEQEGEDAYRIRIALAGYTMGDIDVTTRENVLVVSGRKQEKAEDRKFLHRGIPVGEFERSFQLADHVEVTGATLVDGVLEIELKREVPEAAKPKKIAIGQAATPKRIGKSASAEAA